MSCLLLPCCSCLGLRIYRWLQSLGEGGTGKVSPEPTGKDTDFFINGVTGDKDVQVMMLTKELERVRPQRTIMEEGFAPWD